MTVTAIDPTTALVVIDLQKAVLSFPYTHPIGQVVANAERLVAAFRERGLPVAFTLVGGPPVSPIRVDKQFARPSGVVPPPDAMDPIIEPRQGEAVFPKRRWGSFATTDLETHLREIGATQIVLVGVATGHGVESTARQGSELGFNITLAVDAMSDMNAAVHENAVERIFPYLGECATTDEILALLRS